MKPIPLLALLGATLFLTSCGLLQSAVQMPMRTLQSVGRGVGLGIEHSEEQSVEPDAAAEKVEGKFEIR
ncbi:hypothetical protein V2O64_12900 [Verrucomicrobiaceae bacterium 227]